MPAIPILLCGARGERTVEVFGKSNTHRLGKTDGDIDAARKVAVNLCGIQQNEQKNVCAVELVRLLNERLDADHGGIGYDQLFEVSPHNAEQSCADGLTVKGVLAHQLLLQIAKAADRSLQQLREKGDKKHQFCGISLGSYLFAVDVDEISHRLEGVKGDAKRQKQRRNGQGFGIKCRKNAIDIPYRKGCVFQNCKHTKAKDKSHSQDTSALLFLFGAVRLALLLGERGAVFFHIGILTVGKMLQNMPC